MTPEERAHLLGLVRHVREIGHALAALHASMGAVLKEADDFMTECERQLKTGG